MFQCKLLDADVVISQFGCKLCQKSNGVDPPDLSFQKVQNAIGINPPSFPTAVSQIKAFMRAIIKWVFNPRSISISRYLDRLSICKSCSKRNRKRCGLCGCFIPLKALLPAEKCPDTHPRWDAVYHPVYPAGKIGPYHRDDIADVYQKMEDGEIRSSGGCGCYKPKPSLPIIGQDA